MHCNVGCQIYGAQRVAISIKDSVVLLHSPVGCSFATLLGYAPSHGNDVRQACTYMIENDVIRGGTRSLEESVRMIQKYCCYEVLIVITSCTTELINDDAMQVMVSSERNRENSAAGKPWYLFQAPGFQGDEYLGQNMAMRALIGRMESKDVIPNSVNLIGFFRSDYKVDGDLENIREMLAPLTVNAVFPYDTYANIMNIPAASLNVVLKGFSYIGELLQSRFGTPFVEVDYPYGLCLCREMENQVFSAMNLKLPVKNLKAEERVVKRLANVRRYLSALYEFPAAVIGQPSRAHSMARMLREELGMFIEPEIDRSQFEQKDLSDTLSNSNAVMLFGSGYEVPTAKRLGIPCLEFDYPILHKVDFSGGSYAGYQGFLNLLEDIINLGFATHDAGGVFL